MSNIYPSINDDEFYEKITKIYKKFEIPKKHETINEYCNPIKFKLQEPQKFLANYINPDTPYKSILIYHRIGAGKTCSAIQIAEKWKNKRKIIIVLPASLKGSFKNELRGLCGGEYYLNSKERSQLAQLNPDDEEYIRIIKESNKRIEKYYNIYSYNKFVENIKNNDMDLKNSILIIDEIQNMVSKTGTYYKELYKIIHKYEDLRIVLLSATPMFDKPVEIALTINLLKPICELPIGKEFEKMFIKVEKKNDKIFYSTKNMDKFKNMIKGYVSYFRGAPAFTFPSMKIKYVECEMSDFQYSIYKKILKKEIYNIKSFFSKKEIIDIADLPNNFYIGSRFVSNIVYPNKKANEYGFVSLTPEKIRKNLYKYSCKYERIMKSIKKAKGKIFIYSAFKEYGGLKSFIKVLEAFDYKNYLTNGPGKKRFAIWSGNESSDVKDKIRQVYNNIDNLYGKNIKIILGSPSIKEGVSLKAVRYVHIIEPYWNQSRLDQIIGRASRFCSHVNLLEEERNVKVYIYIAVYSEKNIYIDQYIRKLSETKNIIIKEFERAIIEASVDCRLNKNANETEEYIIQCM